MARRPILAAGGIVLRNGEDKPLIAVVRLRKGGAWVLPKGKLNKGENAVAAARREVLEETGYRVYVHEFLGTMCYEVGSGPKIVQFWRMRAVGEATRPLMRDIRAVEWLPLAAAIARLTHPREQAFLAHVGPAALRAAEVSVRRAAAAERNGGARTVAPSNGRRAPAIRRPLRAGPVEVASPPLRPEPPGEAAERVDSIAVSAPGSAQAASISTPDVADSARAPGADLPSHAAGSGKTIVERARRWLRGRRDRPQTHS